MFNTTRLVRDKGENISTTLLFAYRRRAPVWNVKSKVNRWLQQLPTPFIDGHDSFFDHYLNSVGDVWSDYLPMWKIHSLTQWTRSMSMEDEKNIVINHCEPTFNLWLLFKATKHTLIIFKLFPSTLWFFYSFIFFLLFFSSLLT